VPVVTLHCLPPDDPEAIERALHAIVDSVAEATGGASSGTWAHWVPMAAVVQGERRTGFAGHCPVVTVRGRPTDDAGIAAVLTAVAGAIGSALRLPLEDVWVQWLEVVDGRIFAGGDILSGS
jgi:hypothetical protein